MSLINRTRAQQEVDKKAEAEFLASKEAERSGRPGSAKPSSAGGERAAAAAPAHAEAQACDVIHVDSDVQAAALCEQALKKLTTDVKLVAKYDRVLIDGAMFAAETL